MTQQALKPVESKAGKRILFISFSGGATSAYMTVLLLREWSDLYEKIVIVFMNTGQEHELSLMFVEKCAKHFGFSVVWLESVTHHGERKGSSHRIVDFSSATRGPELFVEMAKKYGLPNQSYPHCTRELKLNPFRSYVADIVGDDDIYDVAVGIRYDEADRIAADADTHRVIYPLIKDFPTKKVDVQSFWDKQPFKLQIPARLGNCVWCYKKSDRKHFENILENPDAYSVPKMLEQRAETNFRNVNLFRKNRTTLEMLEVAKRMTPEIQEELDFLGGCGDTCEVFSDSQISVETVDAIEREILLETATLNKGN